MSPNDPQYKENLPTARLKQISDDLNTVIAKLGTAKNTVMADADPNAPAFADALDQAHKLVTPVLANYSARRYDAGGPGGNPADPQA